MESRLTAPRLDATARSVSSRNSTHSELQYTRGNSARSIASRASHGSSYKGTKQVRGAKKSLRFLSGASDRGEKLETAENQEAREEQERLFMSSTSAGERFIFSILFVLVRQKSSFARLMVLGILIDHLQFLSFSFSSRFHWSSLLTQVSFVLNVFTLPVVSFTSYMVVFYAIIAILIFSVACCVYVGYELKDGLARMRFVWTISFLQSFLSVFVSVGFIPTIKILAIVISCTYFSTDGVVNSNNMMFNRHFGDVQCWNGVFVTFTSTLSILFVVVFTIAAALVCLVYFDPEPGRSNMLARSTGRTDLLYLIVKVLVTGSFTVLPDSFIVSVLGGVLLVAGNGILAFAFFWMQPYYRSWLNSVRAAFFLLSMVASLMALITFLAKESSSHAISIVTFVVTLPVWVLGYKLTRKFFDYIDRRGEEETPAKRYITPLHVELTTRFIHQRPSTEVVAKGVQVYEEALELYPTSHWVCVNFLIFLHLHRTRIYRANETFTRLIQTLYARGVPHLDMRFLVYRLMSENKQSSLGGMLGAGGGITFSTYVNFNTQMQQAEKSHMEAMQSIEAFWLLQASGHVDVETLSRTAVAFLEAQERAREAYLKLTKQFPHSPDLLMKYGTFLIDVVHDLEAARAVDEKLRELEEADEENHGMARHPSRLALDRNILAGQSEGEAAATIQAQHNKLREFVTKSSGEAGIVNVFVKRGLPMLVLVLVLFVIAGIGVMVAESMARMQGWDYMQSDARVQALLFEVASSGYTVGLGVASGISPIVGTPFNQSESERQPMIRNLRVSLAMLEYQFKWLLIGLDGTDGVSYESTDIRSVALTEKRATYVTDAEYHPRLPRLQLMNLLDSGLEIIEQAYALLDDKVLNPMRILRGLCYLVDNSREAGVATQSLMESLADHDLSQYNLMDRSMKALTCIYWGVILVVIIVTALAGAKIHRERAVVLGLFEHIPRYLILDMFEQERTAVKAIEEHLRQHGEGHEDEESDDSFGKKKSRFGNASASDGPATPVIPKPRPASAAKDRTFDAKKTHSADYEGSSKSSTSGFEGAAHTMPNPTLMRVPSTTRKSAAKLTADNLAKHTAAHDGPDDGHASSDDASGVPLAPLEDDDRSLGSEVLPESQRAGGPRPAPAAVATAVPPPEPAVTAETANAARKSALRAAPPVPTIKTADLPPEHTVELQSSNGEDTETALLLPLAKLKKRSEAPEPVAVAKKTTNVISTPRKSPRVGVTPRAGTTELIAYVPLYRRWQFWSGIFIVLTLTALVAPLVYYTTNTELDRVPTYLDEMKTVLTRASKLRACIVGPTYFARAFVSLQKTSDYQAYYQAIAACQLLEEYPVQARQYVPPAEDEATSLYQLLTLHARRRHVESIAIALTVFSMVQRSGCNATYNFTNEFSGNATYNATAYNATALYNDTSSLNTTALFNATSPGNCSNVMDSYWRAESMKSFPEAWQYQWDISREVAGPDSVLAYPLMRFYSTRTNDEALYPADQAKLATGLIFSQFLADNTAYSYTAAQSLQDQLFARRNAVVDAAQSTLAVIASAGMGLIGAFLLVLIILIFVAARTKRVWGRATHVQIVVCVIILVAGQTAVLPMLSIVLASARAEAASSSLAALNAAVTTSHSTVAAAAQALMLPENFVHTGVTGLLANIAAYASTLELSPKLQSAWLTQWKTDIIAVVLSIYNYGLQNDPAATPFASVTWDYASEPTYGTDKETYPERYAYSTRAQDLARLPADRAFLARSLLYDRKARATTNAVADSLVAIEANALDDFVNMRLAANATTQKSIFNYLVTQLICTSLTVLASVGASLITSSADRARRNEAKLPFSAFGRLRAFVLGGIVLAAVLMSAFTLAWLIGLQSSYSVPQELSLAARQASLIKQVRFAVTQLQHLDVGFASAALRQELLTRATDLDNVHTSLLYGDNGRAYETGSAMANLLYGARSCADIVHPDVYCASQWFANSTSTSGFSSYLRRYTADAMSIGQGASSAYDALLMQEPLLSAFALYAVIVLEATAQTVGHMGIVIGTIVSALVILLLGILYVGYMRRAVRAMLHEDHNTSILLALIPLEAYPVIEDVLTRKEPKKYQVEPLIEAPPAPAPAPAPAASVANEPGSPSKGKGPANGGPVEENPSTWAQRRKVDPTRDEPQVADRLQEPSAVRRRPFANKVRPET